jgi:hypothetical protein
VTRRDTYVVAACGALALAALVAALVAIALAIVVDHRDRTKIRTLQRQVAALCSRTTVSGVKQGPYLRLRVTTARGC